eukprot:11908813-Karenia_brevis.AAC.1
MGHAKWKDVRNFKTTKECKLGNDYADFLARAGAAKHAVDSQQIALFFNSQRLAQRVQRMMLEILAARSKAHLSRQDNDGSSQVSELCT